MATPTPLPRIRNFEKLGFGLFVHWGIYSQVGKGEWMQNIYQVPVDEYAKLKDTFTACDFDAHALARLAKAAGARYIVLTTRHHDGFSLFDTKGLSDFDVMHSPAGRDLIREYADACREEGIIPFFYHTTLDWHDPRFQEDFDAYLEYLRQSVELLCTNYGKIGGMWFDGNWSKPNADWKEDELYATIRRHQPDAIIVNNTGLCALGEYGNPEIDSVTFENNRPKPLDREGAKKYVAAEMCHTINAHWAYGSFDCNYKSTGELITTLCACRKVGANYLLNIGPEGQGAIVPLQAELLKVVGKWLSVFGEAIYDTLPCGIEGDYNNFGLKNEKGEVFLFVHGLSYIGDPNITIAGGGEGDKEFRGLPAQAKNITWMDNGESLSFRQEGEKLTVRCTGCPYGTNFVVRVAKVTF